MLKEPEAPRRPDENDTRPASGRGDNRLLLWCLVASIFINFGFGLWMNLADVYGEQHLKEELKRAPIKIYHPPPIKKKPKPKPKPKIIPPKPIKIVHVQPKPRPTPPPPRPVQHFTVGTHSTSHNAVVVEPPAPPTPPAVTQPVAPVTTTEPVKQPEPVKEPDPVVVVKQPDPVVVKKIEPVVVKHPPGWNGQIESRDASVIDSSIETPSADGLDPPPTSPCIISYEVDENGRITSVRVKQHSGSSEFDQRCVDAIRGAKGISAYQEHVPYRQRAEYTFNI